MGTSACCDHALSSLSPARGTPGIDQAGTCQPVSEQSYAAVPHMPLDPHLPADRILTPCRTQVELSLEPSAPVAPHHTHTVHELTPNTSAEPKHPDVLGPNPDLAHLDAPRPNPESNHIEPEPQQNLACLPISHLCRSSPPSRTVT